MELKFERDQAGAEEIQEVVDIVLAELSDPKSESSKEARKAGLDPKQLLAARISVTEGEQGVEPVTTTIIVAVVGGVAAHVVNKFWDEVIWPRLKREKGGKPVGKRLK